MNTMTVGQFKLLNLNVEDKTKGDGTESITKDRLKKFNEINGFTDGPATDDDDAVNEDESQSVVKIEN